MDLHFATSAVDGIDAAAQIRQTSPSTQVVVLTGHADRTVLCRAAEAGACSLVPKDGSLPELMGAIRAAGPGAMVVHPRLLRSLMTEPAETPDPPRLSRREIDVLGMLSLGMGTRSISDHLGISLHTCRGYVKSLLVKLDAHSQLEAVAERQETRAPRCAGRVAGLRRAPATDSGGPSCGGPFSDSGSPASSRCWSSPSAAC